MVRMCNRLRANKIVGLISSIILITFLIPFSVMWASSPTITSISPHSAPYTMNPLYAEISGTGFQNGAKVVLTQPGQEDIIPLEVQFYNATLLRCYFNLNGTAAGTWNILVTNPDFGSVTLANGFGITEPNIIRVPLNYPTITDALSHSYDGDIIRVAQGEYRENVVVGGIGAPWPPIPLRMISSLVLEGGWNVDFTERIPSLYTTILTGKITFVNAFSIDGFTITGSSSHGINGKLWAGPPYASPGTPSGWLPRHAAINVTNCSITRNARNGFYLYQDSQSVCTTPLRINILNCQINGNGTAGTGHGIMYDRTSPSTANRNFTFADCIIEGHNAGNEQWIYDYDNGIRVRWHNYNSGGGIYVDFGMTPDNYVEVRNNRISNNTAAKGGAFYFFWGFPTRDILRVKNNIMDNNHASVSGGAIYLEVFRPGTANEISIVNNTIVDNSSAGTSCLCMDIFDQGQPPYNLQGKILFDICNNIFWNDGDNLSGVNATYSDIKDGDTGEGNISTNPLFVNSSNRDYRLVEGSPCIDKGNNNSPDLTVTDFEGDKRIVDGNRDGTATVDMGADEYYVPCDSRGIEGSIFSSVDRLWPPDHSMFPVVIDASNLVIHNPGTQIRITSVGITEYSSKEASEEYGDNIYEEDNFQPDVEITGDLTLNLRSERTGASTGRTYLIIVTATDCSGDHIFTTKVIVPHDKGK